MDTLAMSPTSEWEIFFRLACALVCGGLIGLERETHAQAAGLRTHMVVCVASCLIMMISIQVGAQRSMTDPGRIAAQVVSGMGFLGAGAIIRYGVTIKGLTTAACLWTAAAIGLGFGAGLYKATGLATLMVLIAVFVFDYVAFHLVQQRVLKSIVVHCQDSPRLVQHLEEILKNRGVQVKNVGFEKDMSNNVLEINVLGSFPVNLRMDDLLGDLHELQGVERIRML